MTQTPPGAPPPPEAGFDPSRLRTVTAMHRSRDDRMIAGVCGGLARYLDIDPVVVRVVVAAMTVVGGAGFVLYIAAWLLVPEEGEDTSIVGARLPGRRGEREVRTVGFLIAGVIVVGAVASTGLWSGWSAPWPLLGLAFLGWFMLRPARRVNTAEPTTESPTTSAVATRGATETGRAFPTPARPRRPSRGDGSLAWLTIGVGLIAAAILWLVDRAASGVEWPDYVALELAVVGLGVLLGTWRGNGRRLVPIGLLLGLVLLASAQLPALTAGDLRTTPQTAAELDPEYVLGAGEMRLDLTELSDPEELAGRTVRIEQGMGQVRVIVPDDVDVTVSAHVDFGHVQLFTRDVGGWDSRLDWQDSDDADPNLRLVVDQSFGEVQVMHP